MYAPVDVTPHEIQPEQMAQRVPAWSEVAATPTDISPDEWHQRQQAAIIPFQFDAYGWPQNPMGRTGRVGRNLPKWGENQAGDAVVIAGTGMDRYVLLIQRDDNGVWALPGGMVDPGEDPETTIGRELAEEAGLDMGSVPPTVLVRDYVDDHRASDNAWVTTTVGLWRLPHMVDVEAADDAADARWFDAASIGHLRHAVTDVGELHPGHEKFLTRAIAYCGDDGDHLASSDGSVVNVNHGGTYGIQAGRVDNTTVLMGGKHHRK